jgi:hypothetical protein
MKRFMLIIMLIAVLVMPAVVHAASNVFYNCTLSTGICDVGGTSASATKTPNINLTSVKVKQIWIHNINSTSTVIVDVYKNATSTTAATLMLRYVVPGTPGTYTLFNNELSSTLTNADLYDCPKLGIGYEEQNASNNNTVGTLKATVKYMIP